MTRDPSSCFTQDIIICKESHRHAQYRRAHPLTVQHNVKRVQEIKNKQIEHVPGSIFSNRKKEKENKKIKK